jgi:hypothetical protein
MTRRLSAIALLRPRNPEGRWNGALREQRRRFTRHSSSSRKLDGACFCIRRDGIQTRHLRRCSHTRAVVIDPASMPARIHPRCSRFASSSREQEKSLRDTRPSEACSIPSCRCSVVQHRNRSSIVPRESSARRRLTLRFERTLRAHHEFQVATDPRRRKSLRSGFETIHPRDSGRADIALRGVIMTTPPCRPDPGVAETPRATAGSSNLE